MGEFYLNIIRINILVRIVNRISKDILTLSRTAQEGKTIISETSIF